MYERNILGFCLEISYPVERYKNVSNLCYKNVSFKIRFFWGFPLNFSGEYGKLLLIQKLQFEKGSP